MDWHTIGCESFLSCIKIFAHYIVQQKDGFLHLSTSQQLSGTLDRFFSKDSGADDQLYLLVLPRENIPNDKLQFDSAAGTLFGHIYGVSAIEIYD